jgi:MazG family protein
MSERRRFRDLVAIMERLRGPDGCPWDREQDYGSLRGYLVEECYEAAEAIDRADPAALCEELGDLLFQIVFLARLAAEDRHFDIGDVIDGIAAKMIRRHPHVFGDDDAATAEEVLVKWEAIKRQEKRARGAAGNDDRGEAPSVLDGVPRALPALLKAQRLGTKAARVGFDWDGPAPVLGKVREELGELSAALAGGDADGSREELGDLLFAIAMLARHLEVDAEAALERTNAKFVRRFREVESELERRGERADQVGLEELERLWHEAKRREAGDAGEAADAE